MKSADREKKPKKQMSRRTYFILLLFFLAVLIVSGGVLIFKALAYLKASEQYSALTDSAITFQMDEMITTTIINDDGEEEEVEQLAYPINVDFDTLISQNDDVVGWLYAKDTEISYPVVQGSDNDYYLTHLFNGSSNSSGAIFMEYTNNPLLTDRNTLLYGHNMKDGSMFSGINDYKSQEFYDENPVMYYSTPDCDYVLEIAVGYLTDGYVTVPTSFSSDDSYLDYLDGLYRKSYFDSDVTIEATDNIISLYTCSYEVDEGRFIVVGKLTTWEDYIAE